MSVNGNYNPEASLGPDVTAAQLAQLAHTHANLRVAIAAHPNAYPGLLDWLWTYGDGSVRAAVDARRAANASAPVTAAVVQTQGAASSDIGQIPNNDSAPADSVLPANTVQNSGQDEMSLADRGNNLAQSVAPTAPAGNPALGLGPGAAPMPQVDQWPSAHRTSTAPAPQPGQWPGMPYASPVPAPQPGQWPPAPYAAPQRIASSQSSGGPGKGLLLILLGVVVFIICSVIQAQAGSSMFSSTYYRSGGIMDTLVTLTWEPGWVATIALIIAGIIRLAKGNR